LEYYYKQTDHLSFDERALINFDHPRAIDFELLVHHLKELKAGNTIDQPVYSFVTHNRTDDTVSTHPRKVMIVEGILILANPELRDLFDIGFCACRLRRASHPTPQTRHCRARP
jgi:uridine kinase